ncbi:arginyl-tRNA synthetase [Evansella caseinilytica]|uniref:Arginine--tRNA ligase n=1 Tax=Evansella caseinilytica TaxID=1503961 RepID=A0A1H3QFB9_9BACI|nr:arginyl-tRNA synthetase [Evansella caseinilytica]
MCARQKKEAWERKPERKLITSKFAERKRTMEWKQIFADAIFAAMKKTALEKKVMYSLIEHPKHEQHGDLAFPCFQLAKHLRKAPNKIAEELAANLSNSYIEKAEAVGPYVNVFFHKATAGRDILTEILSEQGEYGSSKQRGKGKVVIDFSSPNIAKPFSMGHLRSTVIGQALANLAEKNGYQAVKINHLGDWGTQFGKLMAAYKKWGDERELKAQPISTLLKLYVRFHEEAENNPKLLAEGRQWFQRLETKDREAEALWRWFRDESIKAFEKVYQLLGITFDAVQGESFYNDRMSAVVKELEDKHLLEESDGAKVVQAGDDMPPCLIQKTDGTTLYATRDLAAALYRKQEYDFASCMYVVGGEQQLHFQQLFAVLEKMGYSWAGDLVHVPFGLILKDGKKMSTRKGKIIFLERVIQEAIDKAKKNILEKNPQLPDIGEVAEQVGVGAVIFHDLKNERMGNVEFNVNHMLTFEGETGPYVQYTAARAQTLLEKARLKEGGSAAEMETVTMVDEEAWEVIKLLEQFPSEVVRAYESLEPSVIAKYLVRLSQAFNSYYGKVKILSGDAMERSRLAVAGSVIIVLKEGLRLLNIQSPQKM